MSTLTMCSSPPDRPPGYISDPVIDTSKNQIIYAHCVGQLGCLVPMARPIPTTSGTIPKIARAPVSDR